MWLAKPVYEALPYYYVALGLIALGALFYVDYWYWPVICTVVGVASLAAGVYVWLARRRHRSRR
jgi:Flp pilus assembly protein TadB